VALQDLDFISVWVFNEKESRHQRPLAIKLLDRVDLDACSRHVRVFGVEIVDREGDMPVARAQIEGSLRPWLIVSSNSKGVLALLR
jgi:hypothetical protein